MECLEKLFGNLARKLARKVAEKLARKFAGELARWLRMQKDNLERANSDV